MILKNIFLVSLAFSTIGLTAQTVTPEVNGSLYSLSFNNIEFQVDAARGAKVRSFMLNGNEFLVSEEESPGFLWGSTLWPAPQSWSWPPKFTTIEDGEYTASIDNNIMNFVSVDELDMQFTKAFWANETDTSINISYTMTNTGSTSRRNALWELTRPPVNGLTFWPTGPAGAWGDLSSSIIEQGSYSWIDIGAESRSNLKFFADGSQGWFAHVDANRNLLIKTFTDVDRADFANGEGEIELWIADNYIELENLGAAKDLNTNDVLTFDLKWYIREVPAEISIVVGNNQLVNYVNGILGLDETVSVDNALELSCFSFPNPATSYLQFSWSAKLDAVAQLHVFDAMGKLQFSQTIEKESVVNIKELNSGVFFYSVNIGNSVKNGKFIKL